MNMHILVTGGTGFIGSHLVEKLVREGHDVRCLVRASSNKKFLDRLGVDILIGDLTNKKSLKGITKDIDVVFHLAAQMRKWNLPEKIYYETNVIGTRNIIEVSLEGKVKQFIHCSSTAVLGSAKEKPINENFLGYYSGNSYARTKAEAEKIVLSFSDGISTTIIYPDMIYGPGNLTYLPIFNGVKSKTIPIIGNGKNFHQPTYVSDLVNGFLLTLRNKKAYNENFIIVANPVTTEKFLETIADELNVSLPKFKIPLSLAKVGCFFMENSARIFKFQPMLNKAVIEFFTWNHWYDNSKAKRILGFEPKVNLAEGINRSVEWYEREGYL